jgi:hypothetical protein
MGHDHGLTFDPEEYPGGVVYSDQRPESFPALLTVLDAIDSASDSDAVRRKFRILTIVCAKYHRLAEVFPTPEGPVVYGLGRAGSGIVGKERLGNIRTGAMEGQNRAEPRADRLTPPFGPADMDVFMVQCHCREAVIPRAWIATQMSSGRHRVVWEDGVVSSSQE